MSKDREAGKHIKGFREQMVDVFRIKSEIRIRNVSAHLRAVKEFANQTEI